MGFLDFLPVIGKVLDRILPDPAAKAAAQFELVKLAQTADLAQLDAEVRLATGQTDINKIEAGSPRLFVSGWRPWLGWVGGFAFASQYVIGPYFTWISALVGHPTPFPQLDLAALTPLVTGMLGLVAARTVEKVNRVASA